MPPLLLQTPAAPALAVLLVVQDDAARLEATLAATAAALAAGDEVAVVDHGSGDDSAVLADHFIARQGFGADVTASFIALGATPPVPLAAARAVALQATSARHLILLGGGDLLRARAVARLRGVLAADPPAVLATERHWWIEPGLMLPATPLPGPGSLVLRRDLAEDPTLTWPSGPDPGAILARRRRLAGLGAADLGATLLASPLPRLTLPAVAQTATDAAALIAAARAAPLAGAETLPRVQAILAALPATEREILLADPRLGRLSRALTEGGTTAETAWTQARLAAARRLIATLIRRLSRLAAERDALIPDAGELIRAHARLTAEIAAGRARQ